MIIAWIHHDLNAVSCGIVEPRHLIPDNLCHSLTLKGELAVVFAKEASPEPTARQLQGNFSTFASCQNCFDAISMAWFALVKNSHDGCIIFLSTLVQSPSAATAEHRCLHVANSFANVIL